MLAIIKQFVSRMLMGKGKGILQIPPHKAVDDFANDLYKKFKQNGVSDEAITNPKDVKIVWEQITNREAQIFTNNLKDALQKPDPFKKAGEVFDLKGKKIKNPQNMMGGEEIIETDAEILARLKKVNKESLSNMRYEAHIKVEEAKAAADEDYIMKVFDPEDFATGGRAGYKDGLGPSDQPMMGPVFETNDPKEAAKEVIKRLIKLEDIQIPFDKKLSLVLGPDLESAEIKGVIDILGGELNFGAGMKNNEPGFGFNFTKQFAAGGVAGLLGERTGFRWGGPGGKSPGTNTDGSAVGSGTKDNGGYQNVHQTGAITQTPINKGRPPGGGDRGMTYTKPPVTTGGQSPFGYTKPEPKSYNYGINNITKAQKFKKFIAKNKFNIEPWEEDAGNLFQTVANMPKYWGIPSGITGKIPFAHGFKTKEAMEAAKKFGFDASRFKNIPTTSEIEKVLSTGNINKLKEAEGVFGATGKKMSDAVESAVQYAKGTGTRGVGKVGDIGNVLKGYVDSSLGYVDRGLLGNIQTRLPSGVVNKALNLGPASAQIAGKPIAQSMLNKLGARALPGANIALGGASALGHLTSGNYGQAAMAGLSMVPGPVGLAGLGGEMLLGAPSMTEQGLGSYTGPRKGRINQAHGGPARQNFVGGGISRRAFLKWLGSGAAGIGAAKSGLFGLLKGGGKKQVIKELTSVPIKDISGMPVWFKPLVNKVIKEGDDVTKKFGTVDREIVHTTKLPNSQTDVIVTQDLTTGNVSVDIGMGKHGFKEGHLGQPVRLEYKAAEDIMIGPDMDDMHKVGVRDPHIKVKRRDEMTFDQKKHPDKTSEEFWVEEAEFTGGHPENVKFEDVSYEKFGEHGSNFDEVEKFATGKVKKTKTTESRFLGKKYLSEGDDMASGGRVPLSGGLLVKGGNWFLKSLRGTREAIKNNKEYSPERIKHYLNQIDNEIKNIESGGKIPDEVIQTIRSDPKFKGVWQNQKSADPDLREIEEVLLEYGQKHAEGGRASLSAGGLAGMLGE